MVVSGYKFARGYPADVFVIPSREESFGLTALEATACGCRVVGFAICGLPDIIEDRRTGYLAAPFEIRQLRGAIELAKRRCSAK
jgi:glycosyltransferase involved in cell wall biosynthesis